MSLEYRAFGGQQKLGAVEMWTTVNFAGRFAGVWAFCLLLTSVVLIDSVYGHDGPDPVAHWSFHSRFVSDGTLKAQLGPDVKIGRALKSSREDNREGLLFDNLVATPSAGVLKKSLGWMPKRDFTITALASISTPQQYGGFFSCLQDNGAFEKGVVLGYSDTKFYVGLATVGADDGDGKMTYLYSDVEYVPGKLYHVSATYDGATLTLYVNGKLAASTKEQSGDVLYPKNAKLGLGGYLDLDENAPHEGELHHVKLYSLCATAEGVKHDFSHSEKVIAAPTPEAARPEFELLVKPYLQFATQNEITVMWETSLPVKSSVVEFGETVAFGDEVIESKKVANIYATKIQSLKPATQYFYRVTNRDAFGAEVQSKIASFKTAPEGATPFSFAVISDTQGNPKVSGTVAKFAWEQRPSFMVHAGDLVDTGSVKRQWVHEFFASLDPLVSRVPFYPVLGNHEQDAHFYYDYTALPDPSYYYTFKYGNAQFFMLDTNKDVSPGSEQFVWLEKQLAACKSKWKFVCHHHPMYSADENDYGNLWKTNKSSHGDPRARKLVPLYDKYGVNIVFNGHIHSYERTWPMYGGKPVSKKGTMYLITGGGGGGLETPAPHRPPFSNHVRRGHHYTMVHVNGTTLEYRAYDLENRLFDTFKLDLE